MFFDRLGLVSSEEHIPQGNENTEKAKWLLDSLESAVTRPRQARYQAALHRDMKCEIHSKALSNFTPNPSHAFYLRGVSP